MFARGLHLCKIRVAEPADNRFWHYQFCTKWAFNSFVAVFDFLYTSLNLAATAGHTRTAPMTDFVEFSWQGACNKLMYSKIEHLPAVF
ncbi:MAG TPA: hypothetical protein DCG57_10345 [Candidatus Riflebacteria bacterium]|nr:hypothetical protein [Candidatus Riflebacteria bacterium]